MNKLAFRATGHLYKRNGFLTVWQKDSPLLNRIDRDRFDRTARLRLESYGADGKSVTTFGYTHVRQGSNLGPDATEGYKGRFGITDHGLRASRQWLAGGALVGLSATATRDEYDNGWGNRARYLGDIAFSWSQLGRADQLAFTAGTRSAERFGLLPDASLIWKRESDRLMWLSTIGYSEREPSLHELYLPLGRSSIYGASEPGYEESGNSDLHKERQFIGSLRLDIGKADNSLALSVVGGKIWDGIDWYPVLEAAATTLAFTPKNDDITFVTSSLTKDVRLSRFLRFHGGASYHYIDYASGRAKAYQPDYQAFGGAELHVYWRPMLIHLYAYGEAVYLGPYDGYRETGLGETMVINTKVSFSMGNFRFHLVEENFLNTSYESREYHAMPGRTLFWGFIWNFLD